MSETPNNPQQPENEHDDQSQDAGGAMNGFTASASSETEGHPSGPSYTVETGEAEELRDMLVAEAAELGLTLPEGASTEEITEAIMRRKEQLQLPEMISELGLRDDTKNWDDAWEQIRQREKADFDAMPRPKQGGALQQLYDLLKGTPSPGDKPKE